MNSQRFTRVAHDLLENPAVHKVPASWWRVYHAIARRQNFKTGRCYISARRICRDASCGTTAVVEAIRFWESIGAISARRGDKKPKVSGQKRRATEFTINRQITPLSPVECSRGRERTATTQKRTKSGRFVPVDGNANVPVDGNAQRSRGREHNKRLLNKRLLNDIPPPPPQGGNGHASETSARPRLSISESTIKEFLKTKSKDCVIAMLKDGDYPIPAFLLENEKATEEPSTRVEVAAPPAITAGAAPPKALTYAVVMATKARLRAGEPADKVREELSADGWDPEGIVWPGAS